MTVLGYPGDSRNYPLLCSLPLRNQRARMVEHSSVRPDGVPTLEGTLCDLMMHVSPLLVHVLSTRRVAECIMSTDGTSVPYNFTGIQMAHAGNSVLIVYDSIAQLIYFRIWLIPL